MSSAPASAKSRAEASPEREPPRDEASAASSVVGNSAIVTPSSRASRIVLVSS
jgi:hypothetical protein